MIIQVSVFDNVFDKIPKTFKYKDWDQFVELLRRLSQARANKGGPDSAVLISPATYKAGTTRLNENVISWAGWAALDIDKSDTNVEQTLEYLTKLDYRFVMYSTASCTVEKPKFRIIFQLDKHVPKDYIKHLWYALNKELLDVVDAQTKDLSRMFYVPGQYLNAWNFMHIGGSKPIDVVALLDKIPFVEEKAATELSEELKTQLIEFKKSQLTNSQYTWTNYKDCPFVNQKLVKNYSQRTEGWYHHMYLIMLNIAYKALEKKYPICVDEIVDLAREIDNDNGNWYKKRKFHAEAKRALEYAFKTS